MGPLMKDADIEAAYLNTPSKRPLNRRKFGEKTVPGYSHKIIDNTMERRVKTDEELFGISDAAVAAEYPMSEIDNEEDLSERQEQSKMDTTPSDTSYLQRVAADGLSKLGLSANVTLPPCVILLNGFPSVGKFTIARALQKSFPPGTKSILIDNESIIEQTTKKFAKRTPAYYVYRKAVLRTEFFDKITPDTIVIMTAGFAVEPHSDVDQWFDHVALAKERGFTFFQVNVLCDMKTNKKRLTSEERLKGREAAERGGGGKMKCILPERLEHLRATTTILDPGNQHHQSKLPLEILGHIDFDFMRLNTTGKRVAQSVNILMEHLDTAGKQKAKGLWFIPPWQLRDGPFHESDFEDLIDHIEIVDSASENDDS